MLDEVFGKGGVIGMIDIGMGWGMGRFAINCLWGIACS